MMLRRFRRLSVALALLCAAPAVADNYWKVDTFDTGTTTAVVTKSGYTFQPKLVIAFFAEVVGATGTVHKLAGGIGFTCNSKQRSIYWGGIDALGFANGVTAQYAAPGLMAWNPSNPDTDPGTNWGKGTFALTSDGYTFTPSIAFNGNWRISTISIGGSDVNSCDMGDISTPLATGNSAYTNVFTFDPDMVFLLGAHINQNVVPAINGNVDTNDAMGPMLGAFDKNGNQFVAAGMKNSESDGVCQGFSVTRSNACFFMFGTPPTYGGIQVASFVSIPVSSKGFTINFSVNDATAYKFSAIGLKMAGSGAMHVGTLNSATSVTTVSVTGLAEKPTGVLLASGLSGTANAIGANMEYLLAASDGTTTRSNWDYWETTGGTAGSAASKTICESNATYAYLNRTGYTAAAEGSATLSSRNADGFTLSFDDGDPTANTIGYVTLGPAAAAAAASSSQPKRPPYIHPHRHTN